MLVKAVIPAYELGVAKRVVALIEDVMAPAPAALTMFESPVHGHVVEAYFSEPIELSLVRQLLHDAGVEPTGPITVAEVPDLNWVAISQAALPPVVAGRFTIHGSHDRASVGSRLNAIEIDAGEAFGTAHHATTLGCLEAIDRVTRQRAFRRVLDLGCGTGVLAIAAAYALPAARIIATDIDPEAVRVAIGNAALNGVAGHICFKAAPGLTSPVVRSAAPFDLVVANILANPLMELAPALARAIAPGGKALLSGLLVAQSAQVVAAYRATGFHLIATRPIAGWSTIELMRRA